MAWNEPGGSGNKDPWGGGNRGGNNQGPPDLDEVVKQLQQKFSAIFGGGKKRRRWFGFGQWQCWLHRPRRDCCGAGGGMGSSPGILYRRRRSARRGAAVRRLCQDHHAGAHWHPTFIQSVEVVNVEESRALTVGFRQTGGNRPTSSTVGRESLMLTQDENIGRRETGRAIQG